MAYFAAKSLPVRYVIGTKAVPSNRGHPTPIDHPIAIWAHLPALALLVVCGLLLSLSLLGLALRLRVRLGLLCRARCGARGRTTH